MIDLSLVYFVLGVVLGIIPFALVFAGFYCASLSWRMNARSMPMPKRGVKR